MSSTLVWFRRDLRDFDHAALYHALKNHRRVFCVFVFDSAILDALPDRADRRVEFIHASVVELDAALRARGGGLIVRRGDARDVIPTLAAALAVSAVYTNRDYEPMAIARDDEVAERLRVLGIGFETFKDQVIFEKSEVLTQGNSPFSVFTPYKRAWLKTLTDFHLKAYPVERYAAHLAPPPDREALPTLGEIGFERTDLAELGIAPGMSGGRKLFDDFLRRIAAYKAKRDFPALKGVSYLSVHLRFGTVSIRELARSAHAIGGEGAETWLSELVWRDFYFQILWHHPRVVGACFRPEYDRVQWDDAPERFAAWCEARTGYPIVDAGMRELWHTGVMHNRVRMVVASFLVKHLLIDWRHGEKWFWDTLVDADPGSNPASWQWVAGSGADAAPYFRIFNPVLQGEKFDPDGAYVSKWVPELARLSAKLIHQPWEATPMELAAAGVTLGKTYPEPMVDHKAARARALAAYAKTRTS